MKQKTCVSKAQTKMNVKVEKLMESKPFVVSVILAFDEGKTMVKDCFVGVVVNGQVLQFESLEAYMT